MTKVKKIEIWGKEWFQKSYGNSYNAVKIYINDKKVATLPIAYGYGSVYEQRGEEWLEENGYLKGKQPFDYLTYYCRDRNIELVRHKTEVSTERELKKFAND